MVLLGVPLHVPLRPPHAPLVVGHPLAVGDEVVLGAEAVRSLRFREVNVKEAFTVGDAKGEWFRASLTAVGGDRAEARVYEKLQASPESPAEITLVAAVLGRQRMLLVAQKATELGVVRILPVFSAKSVGPEGLAHEKAHAWPGQTLRASKQCRRASVPEMKKTVSLSAALEEPSWKGAQRRFVLDDRAAPPSARRPLDGAPRGPCSIALAVGPEGGWTMDELALLAAHGAEPLRLGGRVLRAETAVIAGLAVLQHALGDMR